MLSSSLLQAFRSCFRRPLAGVTVILTLALGVGAGAAVFTLMDRLWLRPLRGVADPARLAWVRTAAPSRPDWFIGINAGDAELFREHARQASAFGSWKRASAETPLGVEGALGVVPVTRASWDLLRTLGVRPLLGRAFTPEEDRAGGPPVALLSERLWRNRLGADPAIVGKSLVLGGQSREVVGVLPELSVEPCGAALRRGVVVPLALTDAQRRLRQGGDLGVVARLAPGASLAGLDQELQALEAAQPAEPGHDRGSFCTRASLLAQELARPWRASLLLQGGAMAFLLLIACSNIAGLLLARGLARRGELALRAALGADRTRLLRTLLLEAVPLGLLGALAGLAVGWGVLRVAALQLDHPGLEQLGLDPVLAFAALVLGLLAALAAAVVPAWWSTRGALVQVRGADRRTTRLRSLLVGGQLALAMAMLVLAGLLGRALWRLERQRPGFDPDRLVSVVVAAKDRARAPRLEDLLGRVAVLPGVACAAMGDSPAGVGDMVNEYRVAGEATVAGGLQASCAWVSPGYFASCGIRLREGRSFEAGERGVVIVNEALARRHWPGQSAVGRLLESQVAEGPLRVVGVVEDVRRKESGAELHLLNYFPWPGASVGFGTLLVRTEGAAAPRVEALRQALKGTLPEMELRRVQSLDADMAEQMREARARTWLLGAYAGTALLLAAVGIHGLVAFAVAQRTRELGIRFALGAPAARVLGSVLGQGGRIALAGLMAGTGLGWALGRILASQRFGVDAANDPAILAASAGVLLLTTLLACLLPALRAARVQPAEALRSD